jgi:hypothetical protein
LAHLLIEISLRIDVLISTTFSTMAMELSGRAMNTYALVSDAGQAKYWPLDESGVYITEAPLAPYNFAVWLLHYQKERVTPAGWAATLTSLPPLVQGEMALFHWRNGQCADDATAEMVYMCSLLKMAGVTVHDTSLVPQQWQESKFKHTCLPDAVAALGFAIEIERDGPFDIQDALDCLEEDDLTLKHIVAPANGLHIAFFAGHFTALDVSPGKVEWKGRHWTLQLQWHQLSALFSINKLIVHNICDVDGQSPPLPVVHAAGGTLSPHALKIQQVYQEVVSYLGSSYDRRSFQMAFVMHRRELEPRDLVLQDTLIFSPSRPSWDASARGC